MDRSHSNCRSVLESIIGVYSPNPSCTLSLLARLKDKDHLDLFEVEKRNEFARVPAFRGSNYLVLQEDMETAMSSFIDRPENPSWDKRYKDKLRLVTAEKEQEIRENLNRLFEKPIDIQEFKASTGTSNEMAKPLLNKLCYQGVLIRVGTDSKWSSALNYQSLEVRYGRKYAALEKQKAANNLAERYFKAFGPARLKDFAWWLGSTQKIAKEAMEKVELAEIEDRLFLLKEDLEDFNSTEPEFNNEINILPQWDAYTMGYAGDGRDRLVDEKHLDKLYGKIGATGGNARPCILLNGLVVAAWRPQKKGNKLNIEVEMFERSNAATRKQITRAFDEIKDFLVLSEIKVNFA